MLTAVFDTSPLQALHRGGVLEAVGSLYFGISIPESVESQTREAFLRLGIGLVPNIDELPWLKTVPVQPAELAAFETAPPDFARPTHERRAGGLVCFGYGIDREEFEVLVLAKRIGAIAIVDDHRGLRSAQHLRVPTATTREVLAALRSASLMAEDVASVVRRIETTGYVPTRRASRPVER